MNDEDSEETEEEFDKTPNQVNRNKDLDEIEEVPITDESERQRSPKQGSRGTQFEGGLAEQHNRLLSSRTKSVSKMSNGRRDPMNEIKIPPLSTQICICLSSKNYWLLLISSSMLLSSFFNVPALIPYFLVDGSDYFIDEPSA